MIFDLIVDDAAEKRDVGAGADLQEHIRGGRAAREAQVDHHHLRVAIALGLKPHG